jgi:hypothetical protein
MESKQDDSLLQMHLDYDGGHILHETTRWSRFLSIVGIIGVGFCVLVLGLAGSAIIALFSQYSPGIAAVGGALFMVLILLIVAIFGIAIFMLLRFSVLTRRGIDAQDQAVFAAGMRCLKIYFIINGVLAILGLLGNLLSITKLFHT